MNPQPRDASAEQIVGGMPLNEEQLRFISERAQVGYWQWDAATGRIEGSAVCRQLCGLGERDEMSCERLRAILHPDDRERVERAVNDSLATAGRDFDIECRIVLPDGDVRWIHVRGSAGFVNGTPVKMAGVAMDITRGKTAEDALRQNEERLRIALQSAGMGMWDWDLATNRGHVTAETQRLFGLPETELEIDAAQYSALIHPDDIARMQQSFAATMQTGVQYDVEYRIRRSDGAERWIHSQGRRLVRPDGRVVFIGVSRDITERKRAVAALLESEQRFAKAFRASPEALVISTQADGVVLEMNESCLKLFGFTREEVVGRRTLDLGMYVNASDRERLLAVVREQGCAHDFELPVRRRTGEVRTVVGSIDMIEVGGEACILTIIRDVTDKNRAESELRASEERFRNMADNSPLIVWMTDSTGRCTYLNKGWYKFTGKSESASPELDWLDGLHPDDRRQAEQAFFAANDARVPVRLEYRLGRADGEYRWVIDTAAPRFGPGGEFLGYIGSVIDINERKAAELVLAQVQTQLRQHADQLEHIVAKRTAELRETNEQLETFVYSVAHDLRAPLRSITGYAQLLAEDYGPALDQTGRTMLQRMEAASEFMDKLLLDLLAFGRTASAQIELGPVSLEKVWQAAQFQCAAQIEDTEAQVDAVGPFPLVRAHEATLGQVLANLLANALKFVARGVRPQVRFRVEDRGARVRLWVEDNGIGIPREQQQRVFRVFERLNGARYPGTGIGLSIVRKGAERMEGSAGVESEPGVGSRFWVELPKSP